MAMYDSIEYKGKSGEYHLIGQDKSQSKEQKYGVSYRNVIYHNPIVKQMSICDELAVLMDRMEHPIKI